MYSARKGFTLVELLFVIVIIGVLAAIAIPRFGRAKSQAYITAMKSDLRNMVAGEATYFSDSARYTASLAAIGFKQSTGVNTPTIVIGTGYWTATVTHSQLAGHTCGIGINTTNPIVTTAGEGEPACN